MPIRDAGPLIVMAVAIIGEHFHGLQMLTFGVTCFVCGVSLRDWWASIDTTASD